MAFPTTSVLDTFTGADGTAPPSANWSQFAQDGSILIKIVGNSATSNNATSRGGCYWNPATFGPDCEAYCTISTLPITSEVICLSLRCANPGTSVSGYRLLYKFGASTRWSIQRLDAGAGTTLATADTNDLAAGDKIGFGAVGNTLTAYRFNSGSWASIVSYDISGDATKYTGAGSIALSLDHQTVRADDFGGGTVVSAAGTAWNKVITQNFTPEFDIIEYGSRAYSGYGNAPSDWTSSPDRGSIGPRVINPYYY